MIFKAGTRKEADAIARWVNRELGGIPYKDVRASDLGGLERMSIIIRLSMDPRSKWNNGIYHNSRYAMFHLSRDGTLEMFSRRYDLPKMRKTRVSTLPHAMVKIKEYLKKAKEGKR